MNKNRYLVFGITSVEKLTSDASVPLVMSQVGDFQAFYF